MDVLLPHQPEKLRELRKATTDAPLRVLVSGCLAAWPCGMDGTDYGLGNSIPNILSSSRVKLFPFCPEQHTMGTPRSMPDITGGDGFDVLAGRARVLDEKGVDLTAAMKEGARAMVDYAMSNNVEVAILTDMSAACGSQVISDGCRLVEDRRYRKGVGVATAMILQAGITVVSQRDPKSLAALVHHLEDVKQPSDALSDFHDHPWVKEHFTAPHPRSDFGLDESRSDPGAYVNDFED